MSDGEMNGEMERKDMHLWTVYKVREGVEGRGGSTQSEVCAYLNVCVPCVQVLIAVLFTVPIWAEFPQITVFSQLRSSEVPLE